MNGIHDPSATVEGIGARDFDFQTICPAVRTMLKFGMSVYNLINRHAALSRNPFGDANPMSGHVKHQNRGGRIAVRVDRTRTTGQPEAVSTALRVVLGPLRLVTQESALPSLPTLPGRRIQQTRKSGCPIAASNTLPGVLPRRRRNISIRTNLL